MSIDIYKRKMEQLYEGKKIFQFYLQQTELTIQDCVIILVTENQETIGLCKKYLGSFQRKYKFKNVYLFLYSEDTKKIFSKDKIQIILCKDNYELLCMARYLSIFELENQIVLFTEKDSFGAKVEDLLDNKFSLEEYVAVGLFRLDDVEE